MSSEDRRIDAGTTDQDRADLGPPARCDPMRNTVLAGSGSHGSGRAGTFELPEKLVEAWTLWAATHLS